MLRLLPFAWILVGVKASCRISLMFVGWIILSEAGVKREQGGEWESDPLEYFSNIATLWMTFDKVFFLNIINGIKRSVEKWRYIVHWGERRDNSQVSEIWLSEVRDSAGASQWEGSNSRPLPIRSRGLAALIVWSSSSITPTQHPEMGIFRNVREHWKLILGVLFLASGFTSSGPCSRDQVNNWLIPNVTQTFCVSQDYFCSLCQLLWHASGRRREWLVPSPGNQYVNEFIFLSISLH